MEEWSDRAGLGAGRFEPDEGSGEGVSDAANPGAGAASERIGATGGVPVDVVEAMLAAARVLVGLSVQSVADLGESVTLPQLRVLVLVASRSPANLNEVAAGIGVHPSNATRAVERLVVAGLLERREDPADRRYLRVQLAPAGAALVDGMMQRRRAAIGAILDRMAPEQREQLGSGAAAFAEAGGEIAHSAAGSLGWITAE